MISKIISSLATAFALVMIPLGSPAAHADAVSVKDPVAPHFRVETQAVPVKSVSLKAVPQKYKVVSGDTLSAISFKYYRNFADYPTIVVANNISTPDLIYPGQVFTIPPHPDARQAIIVSSPPTRKQSPVEPSYSKPETTAPAPVYTPAPVTYGSPQALARSLMSGSDFGCFDYVISRESGWSVTATNPSSGAYGLGQALPGSKMASAGSDWRTNPRTQIRWVIGYMDERYGSICGAASFWSSHSWY